MNGRLIDRVRSGGDRGSTALELALCVPVVIIMILAVVAMGRVARSKEMVVGAASASARAASLAFNPAAARSAALRAARQSLSDAGVSCTRLDVSADTSAFRPGGQVRITVSCTADLSRLALAGVPGSHTLRATATQPIDSHRALESAP